MIYLKKCNYLDVIQIEDSHTSSCLMDTRQSFDKYFLSRIPHQISVIITHPLSTLIL